MEALVDSIVRIKPTGQRMERRLEDVERLACKMFRLEKSTKALCKG
jgi:CDP-glycerol glycerophosphotransferase (TagB/SpsB family)